MRDLRRRLLAIARKEVPNLVRERWTLWVCFGEPIFTLALYGYCLNFNLQHLPFAVWDQDHSQAARQIVRQLEHAGGEREATFDRKPGITDPQQIELLLSRGTARFVLVIPRGFGRDLAAGRMGEVQALFDAADSNTAGITAGYLGSAIAAYNVRLSVGAAPRRHGAHPSPHAGGPAMAGDTGVSDPIDLRWRVLYNPRLRSEWFIVPGMIAVLLSILAATLTSTTITRERELGSMESLLTSPVGPVDLVLGKMLPYLVVSLINVVFAVVAAWALFGVQPRGSVFTLTLFTLLFLPGMLSLGMIISAVAPTQQFALLLTTLTGFLPTLFLTGFALPRSNMFRIVQWASWPLPATQYMLATRAIYLKGAGLETLGVQAVWLFLSGAFLLSLAILAARWRLARGLG
jgi:ABC-2 type transport system permease protein